jgi:glutamate dehydrogenase
VGEGGNLGFTQLSRIEYALNKGSIYTDFIDNSGGVNCSDHEVNLKILLSDAIRRGQLMLVARNRLLAELTSEISHLVLQDNYQQAQAIDLGAMRSSVLLDVYKRYLNYLTDQGAINRQLENLPDDKALLEREEKGLALTNPELAILFSYTKNLLKEALLKTNVPDDPYFFKYIERAFPRKIKELFALNLQDHYLRREIIATQIINTLVNEMGCVLVYRLQEETGAPLADIVRAYVAVRDVFNLPEVWEAIEKLDGKVDNHYQLKMMLSLTQVMRRAIRWLLIQHHFALNIPLIVKKFGQDVQELNVKLSQLMKADAKQHLNKIIAAYKQANIPSSLSTKVASIGKSFAVLDIVYQAHQAKIESLTLAEFYYRLDNEFSFFWLKEQINDQKPTHRWDILALVTLRDQCDQLQAEFAINIFHYAGKTEDFHESLIAWKHQYKKLLDRWSLVINELKAANPISIVMLFIALKELANLVKSTKGGKLKK